MYKIVKEDHTGMKNAVNKIPTHQNALAQLDRIKLDHLKKNHRVSYHGDHIVCNDTQRMVAIYTIEKEVS